jgi:hypothetical protein
MVLGLVAIWPLLIFGVLAFFFVRRWRAER